MEERWLKSGWEEGSKHGFNPSLCLTGINYSSTFSFVPQASIGMWNWLLLSLQELTVFVTAKLLQLKLQILLLILRKPYFIVIDLRHYGKERNGILENIYKKVRLMKEIQPFFRCLSRRISQCKVWEQILHKVRNLGNKKWKTFMCSKY